MDLDENEILPPSNPLTVKLNQVILKFVSDSFDAKYLPAYEVLQTSGFRDQAKNLEVGGAENSAHVHGLARDIVLKHGGKKIPLVQAKAIFRDFIKPNWPGYALLETGSDPESWHIHLNLPRTVTIYAGLISLAVLGVVGYEVIKSWPKK